MSSQLIEITKDSKVGYRLRAEQHFNKPLEEVFEYFADAGNLEQITPPWLKFQILTEQPIEMKSGALIDYQLKIHYVPIRWRTEITEWSPPNQFVDQQLRGPYKRWYHTHYFYADDNGTKVVDDVHYIVRGGSIIHRLFVKNDLFKIFNYRQEILEQVLNGKEISQPVA